MVNFVATATLAISLMAASPTAPQWEQNYGKALEATRAGHDPLLIVLDKPGTQKAALEPSLLSENQADGETAKLLTPYRLCHVDATTEYGQKVARAFKAKDFPHVAIIDKSGSVVIFHKSGQIKEAEWQKILASHKAGERTGKTHVALKPAGDSSNQPYCPNCQRQQY
jgi:hypothetical protein